MDIATSTLTPTYREAKLEDIEEIVAIEAAAFEEEPYRYLVLRQLFELHWSTWFVAEIDRSIIGYALTLEKDGIAWLITFAVTPRYQRHGYGRALLDTMLERCRELDVKVVKLTVSPTNYSAYNVFKSASFEYVKRDDKYFGPNVPRNILEYRITP